MNKIDDRKYEVIKWCDGKLWLVENTHPYDENPQYLPVGRIEDIVSRDYYTSDFKK